MRLGRLGCGVVARCRAKPDLETRTPDPIRHAGFNGPAVVLHDAATDRESKPGALRASRRERLEQGVGDRIRDARTIILDGHDDLRPLHANAHLDAGCVHVIADGREGILHEVDHDLTHLVGIGEAVRGRGFEVQRDAVAFALRP